MEPNLIHLKRAVDPEYFFMPMVNTAYGNNVINYNDSSIKKYIWAFRYINKWHRGRGMCFGIVASNEQFPNKSLQKHKCDYYVFCRNGNVITKNRRFRLSHTTASGKFIQFPIQLVS